MVDMVKTRRRIANWPVKRLLGLGIPLLNTYLMTVPGRKTGRKHTIPVTIAEHNGNHHLVATRGEVNWVKNVREAGEVTLSRGRSYQTLPVTELDPEDAAPVLKKFARDLPFIAHLLKTSKDAPAERFVETADRHAVFRLG
jgi:deazaflavin-dependent oxidoreductase (nitroreductase family)